MGENATKPVYSNITLPDMFVPVDMRTQRRLRVVRMNHAHMFQPQNAVCVSHRGLETVGGRDVVARNQKMASVETEPDRQMRHLRRIFANHVQFLELPSDLGARPCRTLEQQHQL